MASCLPASVLLRSSVKNSGTPLPEKAAKKLNMDSRAGLEDLASTLVAAQNRISSHEQAVLITVAPGVSAVWAPCFAFDAARHPKVPALGSELALESGLVSVVSVDSAQECLGE